MGLPHAQSSRNRRGLVATAVAAVFAVAGVAVIGFAFASQQEPEQPPLSAPSSSPTATPVETETATPQETNGPDPFAAPTSASRAPATAVSAQPVSPNGKIVGRIMPKSKPVSLAIPAIGVQTSLLHLGLTPQSSLEVPAPGPDYDKAGWYRNSPTPGALGPAVLVGHIDSKSNGPSVFFKLGSLRPNDKVQITREDKTVAVFIVNEVRRFEKKQFPTWLVYGDTDHAALRIITCGGPFDRDSGSYRDNIIVLASLSS
jgi:sortase (surface protein transpeptidase)